MITLKQIILDVPISDIGFFIHLVTNSAKIVMKIYFSWENVSINLKACANARRFLCKSQYNDTYEYKWCLCLQVESTS